MKDCITCSQNNKKPINCFKRNILYESHCVTCLEERNVERVYVGESARSIYERTSEHVDDFKNKIEDSHMYKHSQIEHMNDENPPTFCHGTLIRNGLGTSIK